MPIVPSSSRRIQELLRQLGSERAAARESGIAQLTLLGPRVLEALLRALPTAGPTARLGALEVLETLKDARALPEILALARSDDPAVASRAFEVLGGFAEPKAVSGAAKGLAGGPLPLRRAAARALVRQQAQGMVEATDPLLDVLLDESEDDELRLFVLDALAGLDPPLEKKTLRPLLDRLRQSADPTLADRAGSLLGLGGPGRGSDPLEELLERLPRAGAEDAARLAAALAREGKGKAARLERALGVTSSPVPVRVLAEALGRLGGPSSIPVLGRALERLSAAPDDDTSRGMRALAKGSVHAALAALDSRIALFDLREMLQARPPRALDVLLPAAARVGDASLVPALAGLATESPALLESCAPPFADIVRREGLRRTSTVMKAVPAAHRPGLEALWARTAQRTAARRPPPRSND
jgi:HEAT repeat protein